MNARRFSAWDIHVYRASELLTEALVFFMVVFSPWAFGTTQPWSIWAMNGAGYGLGLLLLIKLGIRWWRGYRPVRWDEGDRLPELAQKRQTLVRALAVLTVLILAYCLVSAANARATFRNDTLTFEYRSCIGWLPHSFDAEATWSAFWMYLGLAGAFWALRDWLLGKSSTEERGQWQQAAFAGRGRRRTSHPGTGATCLPVRLRTLFWVLMINGALLAGEGVVQRCVRSDKLLFLTKPRIHQNAEGQFGPYAYRSNAAQYFNLLWPVSLGFWWALDRRARGRLWSHYVLLGCGMLMAAASIISGSRAGAAIAVLTLLGGGLCLFGAAFARGIQRGDGGLSSLRSRKTRDDRVISPPVLRLGAGLAFFVAVLGLGFGFGWNGLVPRLTDLDEAMQSRRRVYDAARQMAEDYPWFGTGPGSFETVSLLYPRPDIYWPAQLHNDWLETRITFGRVGSGLIGLALLATVLHCFIPGGISVGRRLVILIWLAVIGCMLHAKWDFPFQIYSTLFLFLILCAILSILSRRSAEAALLAAR